VAGDAARHIPYERAQQVNESAVDILDDAPQAGPPSKSASQDPPGGSSSAVGVRAGAAGRNWFWEPAAGLLLLSLLAIAGGVTAFVMLLGGHVSPHDSQNSQHSALATNRLLVRLKDGAHTQQAMEKLEGSGHAVIIQKGSIAVLELADSRAAVDQMERLRSSGLVEGVEEDQWLHVEQTLIGQEGSVSAAEAFKESLQQESLLSSLAPNDSGYVFQWNLQALGLDAGVLHNGLPGAWAYSSGSSTIKVCVVDSGVDYTHLDLQGNIWTNPGEIPGNGIDDDGNGFVDDIHGYNFADDNGDPMDALYNGHGTHVAGIIGAVGNNRQGISGVAQQVSIIACKFLQDDGRGLISDAIRCMDYCEAVGAHITTSSAGDPSFSSTFLAAIREATSDILFVCSAGNDATNADVVGHYPSGFGLSNIIAVAASNKQGVISGYSNWGSSTIDLTAPGDQVWSTVPGNRYKKMDGSSMAVPHVSGTAALLLSVQPELSALDLKELLLASAVESPLLEPWVHSGGGLDIARALGALGPSVEEFPPGTQFDLSFSSAHFVPGPAGYGMLGCFTTGVTEFPVDSQGARTLVFADGQASVAVELPEGFPMRGWSSKTVRVYVNGALTFGQAAINMATPKLADVGRARQVLPLWTSLQVDKISEVSVKHMNGLSAFTFKDMKMDNGRASFQAILHYSTGAVTLSWLRVNSNSGKSHAVVVVGVNMASRDISGGDTTATMSWDMSELLACKPQQLASEAAPFLSPPAVELFTAAQEFDLVNRTVCYRHSSSSPEAAALTVGQPSTCMRPLPTPDMSIHPAGGLKELLWLDRAADWVPIDLLKGKSFPSPVDGKPLQRIFVTGRGTISFAKPATELGKNSVASSLEEHYSLPQVSVLASDLWQEKGGLSIDYKQLFGSLVVTFYRGKPAAGQLLGPLAQAVLSWATGDLCVTYPHLLLAFTGQKGIGKQVIVGASSGLPPEAGRPLWRSDLSRLMACEPPPRDSSSGVPAQIFHSGMLFDLEHQLLRFTPLGGSSVGVCSEPGKLAEFPVSPVGGEEVRFTAGRSVVQLPLDWEGVDGEAMGFPMLGREYTSVVLSADGSIVFDSLVSDGAASLAAMHRTRRIAAMFSSLDLRDSPSARVVLRRLPDMMAITFLDVPIAGSGLGTSSNSFQVVLYWNGGVDIAFLRADRISAVPRAVGVSGGAQPPGWEPTDLSQAPPCAPVLVQKFDKTHPFDLHMSSLTFVPSAKAAATSDLSLSRWQLCYRMLQNEALPVPTSGSSAQLLGLQEDDSVVVEFQDSMLFPFFGTDYRHVHVSSNGFLTFDQRDPGTVQTTADHFGLKRISVFALELRLTSQGRAAGGGVFVSHLPGRVVITYQEVELAKGSGRRVTFQVELHATGAVVMSFLRCGWSTADPVVGISSGAPRSSSWQEADLSAAASRNQNSCKVA